MAIQLTLGSFKRSTRQATPKSNYKQNIKIAIIYTHKARLQILASTISLDTLKTISGADLGEKINK